MVMDGYSETVPYGPGRGWSLSVFAGVLRLLMWILVPIGVFASGCSGINEDARIIVPQTVSPRVTRALTEMQSYVSQAYDAKDKRHLRRLSDLSDAVVERCKILRGTRDEPAPPAAEWGGISDEQYGQIIKIVETLELYARSCRDYAKDMQYSRLEGAWKAFVGQYAVLRRVVEGLEPQGLTAGGDREGLYSPPCTADDCLDGGIHALGELAPRESLSTFSCPVRV